MAQGTSQSQEQLFITESELSEAPSSYAPSMDDQSNISMHISGPQFRPAPPPTLPPVTEMCSNPTAAPHIPMHVGYIPYPFPSFSMLQGAYFPNEGAVTCFQGGLTGPLGYQYPPGTWGAVSSEPIQNYYSGPIAPDGSIYEAAVNEQLQLQGYHRAADGLAAPSAAPPNDMNYVAFSVLPTVTLPPRTVVPVVAAPQTVLPAVAAPQTISPAIEAPQTVLPAAAAPETILPVAVPVEALSQERAVPVVGKDSDAGVSTATMVDIMNSSSNSDEDSEDDECGRTVLAKHIPRSANLREVINLFRQAGELDFNENTGQLNVRLLTKRGKPRGEAILQYATREGMEKALTLFHGAHFASHTRPMEVVVTRGPYWTPKADKMQAGKPALSKIYLGHDEYADHPEPTVEKHDAHGVQPDQSKGTAVNTEVIGQTKGNHAGDHFKIKKKQKRMKKPWWCFVCDCENHFYRQSCIQCFLPREYCGGIIGKYAILNIKKWLAIQPAAGSGGSEVCTDIVRRSDDHQSSNGKTGSPVQASEEPFISEISQSDELDKMALICIDQCVANEEAPLEPTPELPADPATIAKNGAVVPMEEAGKELIVSASPSDNSEPKQSPPCSVKRMSAKQCSKGRDSQPVGYVETEACERLCTHRHKSSFSNRDAHASNSKYRWCQSQRRLRDNNGYFLNGGEKNGYWCNTGFSEYWSDFGSEVAFHSDLHSLTHAYDNRSFKDSWEGGRGFEDGSPQQRAFEMQTFHSGWDEEGSSSYQQHRGWSNDCSFGQMDSRFSSSGRTFEYDHRLKGSRNPQEHREYSPVRLRWPGNNQSHRVEGFKRSRTPQRSRKHERSFWNCEWRSKERLGKECHDRRRRSRSEARRRVDQRRSPGSLRSYSHSSKTGNSAHERPNLAGSSYCRTRSKSKTRRSQQWHKRRCSKSRQSPPGDRKPPSAKRHTRRSCDDGWPTSD